MHLLRHRRQLPLQADRVSRLLPLMLCCLLAQACSTPTSRLRVLAQSQGFAREHIEARGFDHTVFSNELPIEDGMLHVYLEGDGTPWRHRTIIMPDPTPRHSLMLRLMALDAVASIYVGRPCYNGTSLEPGCDKSLWTSDRYSEVVIQSMASVIRRETMARGASRVRLFGHSGGGALAMLLAERLQGVEALVTIAGNLDTDAWTSHHGYTQLYGSLNPASRAPLPADIRQWHLVGALDNVIPPALVRRFVDSQPSAVGSGFASFGHGCCWARVWPAVLEAVVTDRPEQLPGRQFKRAETEPREDAPGSP